MRFRAYPNVFNVQKRCSLYLTPALTLTCPGPQCTNEYRWDLRLESKPNRSSPREKCQERHCLVLNGAMAPRSVVNPAFRVTTN